MVPRHMQLKKTKILASRGVGGAAKKILEVRDVTNVVLLDLFLEMTNRHVFDHADALRGPSEVCVQDAKPPSSALSPWTRARL